MKKAIYIILMPVLLFYCISCKPLHNEKDPLEGKYRMIKENNYKIHLEERFSIYKEYKDGKFIDYKLIKGNKNQSTRFSGKYYIVNDSVYIEYLNEDNMFNQLTDKAYAFKYSIKNDTLTQEGEVYSKINGAKNNFYKASRFKTYYLKVNE